MIRAALLPSQTKIRKTAEKEDLFLLDIMKSSENQDISKSIKQLMTYEGRIAGIYHDNMTRIFLNSGKP